MEGGKNKRILDKHTICVLRPVTGVFFLVPVTAKWHEHISIDNDNFARKVDIKI